MGTIGGSSSVDIDAPIDRCYEIVTDPEGTVAWQDSLRAAKVLERDADGNPTVVETHVHALVRDLTIVLRFDWDEPTQLRWTREGGDVKAVDGAWVLEDLGNGRTRATYRMEIDPGRVLGLLARGPIVGQLRKHLTHQPPEGLKRVAEGSAAPANVPESPL